LEESFVKVLQVCPDSYVQIGGISAHVRNISERLARHHDVTVFATNDGGLEPWNEIINGVKVRRFRCYAPSNSYFLTIDMPLQMRREKFEIIHAHGYHQFPLHLSTLAKADQFVVTPHFHGVGHSPFRNALIRLLKPFGKRSLKKANAIVAVSEFEKNLIRREFGFDDSAVQVIPNGVDFKEFVNLKKRRHDRRSILFVGYLAAYKGAQYLVEVLPKLDKDIVLKVVGRGPAKPLMEKRASQLGVSDRLEFYAKIPRDQLLQLYADADVFALLSRYEAYSIVVAEALAAKAPCIIARTSALAEWEDGITCLGVDYPISIDKLAEQITRALKGSYSTSEFRKWYGKKIPDWDMTAERLEKLYISDQEDPHE
jgi:glycosyltransferase involved in cell wall biosynthesis